MELDRQTIEKRDFPIGRRGYETDAVDAHLEAISQEVEALRRAARSRSGESVASAASAHVQAIVEAAETSAADITRDAETNAARIRQDAESESESTRGDAIARSREHVDKVAEACATMLQRVDAMESELRALFESLRTGANRLNADLSLLDANMGDLYGAAGAAREAPAEHAGQAPAEPAREAAPEHQAPAPAAETNAQTPEAPAPAQPAGGDIEGARLVALNMALNGQSREQTDRYLAENFELGDRAGLLDEVYAAVGG